MKEGFQKGFIVIARSIMMQVECIIKTALKIGWIFPKNFNYFIVESKDIAIASGLAAAFSSSLGFAVVRGGRLSLKI